jgi:hypothetical protein
MKVVVLRQIPSAMLSIARLLKGSAMTFDVHPGLITIELIALYQLWSPLHSLVLTTLDMPCLRRIPDSLLLV